MAPFLITNGRLSDYKRCLVKRRWLTSIIRNGSCSKDVHWSQLKLQCIVKDQTIYPVKVILGAEMATLLMLMQNSISVPNGEMYLYISALAGVSVVQLQRKRSWLRWTSCGNCWRTQMACGGTSTWWLSTRTQGSPAAGMRSGSFARSNRHLHRLNPPTHDAPVHCKTHGKIYVEPKTKRTQQNAWISYIFLSTSAQIVIVVLVFYGLDIGWKGLSTREFPIHHLWFWPCLWF